MLRDPLKGKWFPGVHAAIIDPGLWGEVHAVLAKDSHGRSVETKVRSRTDALLRGLLFAPKASPFSKKSGTKALGAFPPCSRQARTKSVTPL